MRKGWIKRKIFALLLPVLAAAAFLAPGTVTTGKADTLEQPAYDAAQACAVTFRYIRDDDTWTETTGTYAIGDTPDPNVMHWNRIFFKGWDPAITAITDDTPRTYVAQYEYPSVLVKNNNGEAVRQYLQYDYIDDDLLFADFTDKIDDIGSTNVDLGDLIKFENRKDFWYYQTADTAKKHTVDTNLTLEAISFRVQNKKTGALERLERAKELYGEWEVRVSKFLYDFTHGPNPFVPGNMIEWILNGYGTPEYEEAQLQQFLESYYPACAVQDPDNYDLVYLYYYSADLKADIESGKVDDAFLDFKDDYKDSTLTVLNTMDAQKYTVTNSYSLERGNYFLLDMGRYWQSLGYVTKERADALGGVVAKIANAKFRITDWTGTVLYDTASAENLTHALTSLVYLYSDSFAPDYLDAYTVNVEFYDIVVYQDLDAEVANEKHWYDGVVRFFQSIGNGFKGFGKGVKNFFGKIGNWFSRNWRIFVTIVVCLLALPLVIWLIKSLVDLLSRNKKQ